jgi:hypothetical protein
MRPSNLDTLYCIYIGMYSTTTGGGEKDGNNNNNKKGLPGAGKQSNR